jgi:tripartite-type tricarboxylate transporter receptor subunit TctC
MSQAGVRLLFAGLSAIALLSALAGAGPSQAQSKFPEKPVRVIVPYGAGGVADVTTRLVTEKVARSLGQSFVVENRPGAGLIVGARAALTSPPDGYTLFLAGNGSAISESLFKSLPFKMLTDFMPVAPLAEFEMILATKADAKLDTIQKLIDHAKANPGKLNFGTIASGSTQNLSAELFKMSTGVDAPIVIYKTTPELITGILRGDVDVGFDYLAAFGAAISNKQMKALATSGDQRNEQLPGVPTVKESGYPTYIVTSWNAFYGPAGIPKDIITKLNEHVAAALKTEDIRKRMAELGMQPMIGTPEFLDQRMKSDIGKWAEVIRVANIEKQ